MKKSVLILILAFSVLTGCTNRMFYQHPEYKGSVKVEVLDETISTMTETPAEDYLVPNSQVFIGGKGFFQKNIGLMGVVGALNAVNIDRSLNAAEAQNIESQLRVRFSEEFSDILKNAALKNSGNLHIEVVRADSLAEIKLLPSARFEMQPDSLANLSFRVTARCRDNATGKEGEKSYFYTVKGNRSMVGKEGWTDNNSILLKKAATRALTIIAQVIIQDVYGLFNEKLLPAKRQIAARRGPYEKNSILLAEYPDYSIYMPLSGDDALTSWFFIDER